MLKNTQNAYGVISKSFHWSMALIVIGLLLLGYFLDERSYSANQFTLIKLHKSFGLLILYFVALRIIWNFWSKRPDSLAHHQKWESLLARTIHIFLYAALIGMPLSGWVMSMSGGYPVAFFGVEVPSFIDKNAKINSLSWDVHKILSYCLIAGISLHVLGAFKHHFVDKDLTLKRMIFKPHNLFIAFSLIVFCIFVVGFIRILVF